jgi:hypothetical protein
MATVLVSLWDYTCFWGYAFTRPSSFAQLVMASHVDVAASPISELDGIV